MARGRRKGKRGDKWDPFLPKPVAFGEKVRQYIETRYYVFRSLDLVADGVRWKKRERKHFKNVTNF